MPAPLPTLAGGALVAGWTALLADNLGAFPAIPAPAYVTALAALAATTVGWWHYRTRRGEWSRRAFRAGMRAGQGRQTAHRIAEQRRARGLTAADTG